jgi:hypothetical protein
MAANSESKSSPSSTLERWAHGAAETIGAIGTGAYESTASAYHSAVQAGKTAVNGAVEVYNHKGDIAQAVGNGTQAAANYPSEFMQHPGASLQQAGQLANAIAGDIGHAAVVAGSVALDATASTAGWVGNHKLESAEIVAAAAVEVYSVGAATPVLAAIGGLSAAGTVHSLISMSYHVQEHSADIGVLADADATKAARDKAFANIGDATGGDAVGLASAVAGMGVSRIIGAMKAAQPSADALDAQKPAVAVAAAAAQIAQASKSAENTAESTAHISNAAANAVRATTQATENAAVVAQTTARTTDTVTDATELTTHSTDVGGEASDAMPGARAELVVARDASGRPIADGNAERVALTHPPLSASELQAQRAAVESDLAAHNGADDQTILQQFNASNMSADQKNRVLNVLAETRHSYLAPGADGQIPTEQLNSYRHTLGELKAGVESSKVNGLTPRETQDALLASMLSDSHKSGWSASTGGNFFTHHLDGALAADTILSRQIGDGFHARDLAAVKRAIIEHQDTPPGFMSDAYTTELRAGMRAAKVVPTAEDEKAIANIRKAIANPLTSPSEVDGQGGYRLAFSDRERELLRKYVGEGTQNWHVPAPPNAQAPNLASDLNTGKISTVTRTADIDDNYNAEVDSQGKAIRGPFKIAGLRGPRAMPPDLTLNDATQNIRNTMQQNEQFLTDADKARLASPERKAEVESVYEQAKARVAEWLTKRDGHPPDANTPYWGKPIQPPPDGANFQELQAWKTSDEARAADEIQQRFALELYEMRRKQ